MAPQYHFLFLFSRKSATTWWSSFGVPTFKSRRYASFPWKRSAAHAKRAPSKQCALFSFSTLRGEKSVSSFSSKLIGRHSRKSCIFAGMVRFMNTAQIQDFLECLPINFEEKE